jgi:hypothetical protein
MKPIDTYIRTKVSDNGITVIDYQPGNGTRYELMFGHMPNIEDADGPHLFFCARINGGGGEVVRHSIGSYCHFTYVSEKMKLGDEDAKAVAHVVNTVNFRDYPDVFSPSQLVQILPRGMKEDLEAPFSHMTEEEGLEYARSEHLSGQQEQAEGEAQ